MKNLFLKTGRKKNLKGKPEFSAKEEMLRSIKSLIQEEQFRGNLQRSRRLSRKILAKNRLRVVTIFDG